MLVVVGKPIPLPKVEQPEDGMVSDYLARFIHEMQLMHDRHAAQRPDTPKQVQVM